MASPRGAGRVARHFLTLETLRNKKNFSLVCRGRVVKFSDYCALGLGPVASVAGCHELLKYLTK